MSYSKFSVMSKFNEIRCFLLSPKKKTYAKNSFILHFILTVLMLLKICLILNYSRCLEGSVPPVKLAPIYNFYSSLPSSLPHTHTHLFTPPDLINMTTLTRYHMKKSQGTINFNFVKIWLNTHVFCLSSSCLKIDNLEMVLGVTLKIYSSLVKGLIKDVKDLLLWSKELLCYTI